MSIGGALASGWSLVEGWTTTACELVRVLRRRAEPLVGRLGLGTPVPGPEVAGAPPDRALEQDVRDAKYVMPRRGPAATRPALQRADGVILADAEGPLPVYDVDRIVLLARDPWSIFAYWDVTPATRRRAVASLGAESSVREIVRLYDVTLMPSSSGDGAWSAVDVEPEEGAASCYVDVGRAGGSYCAEVGLGASGGRFVAFARSNTVVTPPAQPASDASVSWVDVRRADNGDGHAPGRGGLDAPAADPGPPGDPPRAPTR